MKIIVFGTGNYVTGRGTNQFGTILPAIFEFQKKNHTINEVVLVATNNTSKLMAKNKLKNIARLSGQKIKFQIILNNNVSAFIKNYRKLTEDIYCAVISTPDHTHFNIIKKCLINKYHCLTVKPAVERLDQLNELIKISKKNKLYGAVEFHKRFDRQALIMKDKFQTGGIGDPLYTWTEYSQRKIVPKNFFKSWVSKNNVFQYLGIHYVDLIRFVTNAKPTKVLALGQKNYLIKNGTKTEDSIQAIVEWITPNRKKFSQTLLLNWIDPKNTSSMSDQKFNMVGTNGRVELDQKNRGVRTITEDDLIEDINPDFCRMYGNKVGSISWRGYGIDSIVTFFQDVINLNYKITTKNKLVKTRPSFEESRYSTAVLEAANYSLKNGSVWKKISLK